MTFTTANMPNLGTPPLDEKGKWRTEWVLFLQALFFRTGGPGSPIDINSLQQQDEISQDVPPQSASTQLASQGVNDLWSEQRSPENLSAILSRLDALENVNADRLDLGVVLRRLDELESLLAQPGSIQRDPSVNNPVMDGAATPGKSLYYAREDHAHPTDTSLASLLGATFTGNVTAPRFQTATAAITGSTSGTAKTVYTIPNGAPAVFLVGANIGTTNDTGNYNAFAVVVSDGSSARLAVSNNATLQTITLSGLNIQSTQSSGATQTINAVITRVG